MKVRTSSAEETRRAGFDLGRTLKKGDTVALYGGLGAGKTVFVKGIAKALGIDARDVSSASFTIIAEYGSTPPLYHIDLYRLEDPGAIEDTGVYECIGGEGISVIEWAERMELKNAIAVRIDTLSATERSIEIRRPKKKSRPRPTHRVFDK